MTNKSMSLKNKPQPFLLSPACKQTIWGGNLLKTEYNKHADFDNIAESWECSTHPDGISTVASGAFCGQKLSQVLQVHPEYVGSHPHTVCELPILIKFIDAERNLSIQVHPDDDYALKHENSLGKTEMWYIVKATPGAQLIYGFNNDVNKEIISAALANDSIMKYLRKISVNAGDTFFIEAGTVHGIGAGNLLVEVQENSNITYRMYDYNRVDDSGKKRELHLNKALSVASFKSSNNPRQPMHIIKYSQGCAREFLHRCQYFQVEKVMINTKGMGKGIKFAADSLSFLALICTNGYGRMCLTDGSVIPINQGNTVFFPANSQTVDVYGEMEMLLIRC